MKVGIMQPYLFPYIGYFQLIRTVDAFIIHDDVQYIKGGWINRNRILVNGKEYLFTFSLKKDGYTKKINERYFSEAFDKEKKSFLGTIKTTYSKAPYFKQTENLIEDILSNKEKNIAIMITNSLKKICSYLEISTPFYISSQIEKNDTTVSETRVIELNKKLHSTHYINPIGGTELYSKEHFNQENIQLSFIKSKEIYYNQFQENFVPWLSIIDVMMFNSKEQIKELLSQYELL